MEHKQTLNIVKIGGNVIENEKELDLFLANFSKLSSPKILVHGGGKLATSLSEKLGIASELVNGRRITNLETLDIITMVYAGLVNKKIVANLQKNNCNAIGLSGADANTIIAIKRPVKDIDYGYVGDITTVNQQAIQQLILANFTPVYCAISHDTNGQLLNTNADTIAAEISIAMSEFYKCNLYYCFEKNGVLADVNNNESIIETIDTVSYQELLADNIIFEGMLPKLENCFRAIHNNVSAIHIGNINMLNKGVKHTTITK